jgi:hypothetical protein
MTKSGSLVGYYTVMREWSDGYHSHKETMAHGILVVIFGVAAAIVTSNWPLKFSASEARYQVAAGLTVALLVLLHVGLCRQIFNKRVGALAHEASMEALRRLCVNDKAPPSEPARAKASAPRAWIAKHFLPLFCRGVVEDDVSPRMLGDPLSQAALHTAASKMKQSTPAYDGIMVGLSLAALLLSSACLALPHLLKVEPSVPHSSGASPNHPAERPAPRPGR